MQEKSKGCTHSKTGLIKLLFLCQKLTWVFKCSQSFYSKLIEWRKTWASNTFKAFCRLKSSKNELKFSEDNWNTQEILTQADWVWHTFNSFEIGTSFEMDNWKSNLAAASHQTSLLACLLCKKEEGRINARNCLEKAGDRSRYLCLSAVNQTWEWEATKGQKNRKKLWGKLG